MKIKLKKSLPKIVVSPHHFDESQKIDFTKENFG
jgi:hypothetical protein